MNKQQMIMCNVISFILITLISSVAAQAKSINDLINQNKLTIDLRISKSEKITVKDQIVLSIDVATDRWFSKGITIDEFAIPQLVVLPLTGQTINGTKRVNYNTWVTQTREIVVYPTKAGIYEIPAIAISMAINTEEGIVSGIGYTKPSELEVVIPEQLVGIDNFVVSNKVGIEILVEDLNETTTDNYKIGSAVTQTMIITAENVPAMMLPKIEIPDIEGVSIYRKPSHLEDTKNRGVISGKAIESFTFIFEKSGKFHLPEQTYYWFNNQSLLLEKIHLPEQTWLVSNEVIEGNSGEMLTSFFRLSKHYFIQTIILLFVSVCLIVIYRNKNRLSDIYNKISRQQYRQDKNKFLKAIKDQNFALACHCLYILINRHSRGKQPHQSTQENLLVTQRLKLFYANSPEQSLLVERLLLSAYCNAKTGFTFEQGKRLLKFTKHKSSSSDKETLNDKIKLNPLDN